MPPKYPALVFLRPGQGAPRGVGAVPRIGRDFIPNMNAGTKIVVPFQSDPELASHLSAAGIASDNLPARFSWNNQALVRKHRMHDYDVRWLMDPPNQSTCGSCWAVSSTSAHTDRYSIAHKRKFAPFSAVVTASCAVREAGADGCQGGFPADAGCFFGQVGVPSDQCWPYAAFCAPGAQQCSTLNGAYTCCGSGLQAGLSGGDAGQAVQCADFSGRGGASCGTHPGNAGVCSDGTATQARRYLGLPNSTVSLAAGSLPDIVRRMKLNLYAGGPIVGCYNVYGDFVFMTVFPTMNFRQTNGIYVHIPGKSLYVNDSYFATLFAQRNNPNNEDVQMIQNAGISFGNSLDAFKQSLQAYFDKIDGAHAVTIVGWDSGDAGNRLGVVPYWIVRNSWGTAWNEKGYFRIAMSDPARNINVYTNLERFINPNDNSPEGGATTWLVPAVKPGPNPSPGPYHPVTLGDSKSRKVALYVALGVAVAGVLWFVWYRSRKH